MNIEQFELILCDMYTMDAWSPPLIWKWKKEFKEASTKQWAIRELENYIRKRLHHRSDGSVDEFIRFTNEFAMKMARYSNHSGENQDVKAKLFCPEIAGLFCRIAGLFCHDSRANLSLKPVCFGIAIS